jgi:hypothetical protein
MLTYLPMTTILTQSVWIIIDWWDSQNISVGAQSWHYIIIVSWLTTSVHILSKNVCRATISLRQLAVHSLQYVRHNYYGHTMFTVWMCVGHRPRVTWWTCYIHHVFPLLLYTHCSHVLTYMWSIIVNMSIHMHYTLTGSLCVCRRQYNIYYGTHMT